jgi:anti-anti-sigma factor
MEASKYFLRGEIDVATADDLLTTLRRVAKAATGSLVVDCMDLAFIDAAGIRVLITMHAELAQQGRDLHLVHPSPLLTRILQVLDLTYLAPGNSADGQQRQSPPVANGETIRLRSDQINAPAPRRTP